MRKTHPCYKGPKNLPQVCPWYRVLKDKTNSNNNIELESGEIGYLAEDLLSKVLREWLDYS